MTLILIYLAENFTIDRVLSLVVVIYTYKLVPDEQKHHIRRVARTAKTVRVTVDGRRVRFYRIREAEQDVENAVHRVEADVEHEVSRL